MFQNLSAQQKGSLLAFVGVMFITPDSLFIRLSNIETWGMLFYRGAIPFTVVLIGLLFFYRNNFLKALLKIGYPGVFYTISFAVTNVTFIISIQNTNVANTLIMVAMAPMISAILSAIFLKEKTDRKTWIAILITFSAVTFIFFDSIQIGNFLGDIFGLITALGLAVGAVIVRSAKNRNLVPSAVVGKLFVAIIAFFFVDSFEPPNINVVGLMGFLIKRDISFISFLKRGPKYFSLKKSQIVNTEECFLWETEKASFM